MINELSSKKIEEKEKKVIQIKKIERLAICQIF